MVDAKQLMKVCDYFRSRSSLDLGRSVVYTYFSKNRMANQTEILCGASLGRGNESLIPKSRCQRAGLVDGDICSTLPVDSYKDKRTPVII